MMHGARDGAMRAMLIAGEDPALTDPDQTEVARALKKLDLLVVLEMHLTETAKLADYILPVAAFAEKDGTFSNCERACSGCERRLSRLLSARRIGRYSESWRGAWVCPVWTGPVPKPFLTRCAA